MITLITKILIATRIIHQKKYIRRLHSKLKIRFAKADSLGSSDSLLGGASKSKHALI